MNKEDLRNEIESLLSEDIDPETVQKLMDNIMIAEPLSRLDMEDLYPDEQDFGGCFDSPGDALEKRDIRTNQIKQRFDHHKNGKMNMVYKLWKNRNK